MASVLIVDDEQADRVILGNIVEGAGHEVYFASDGERALEIYLKKSIDLVVTDLHMPHVDGLEFIKTVGALLPETAVIAVSGQGPELLAEARSKGAFVVLSKPVDPYELVEAVAQATRSGRAAAREGVSLDPGETGP